jgi:hypothetical protein
MADGGVRVRTLYLGTGPERVEGVVTDQLGNDMNAVKNLIELAIQLDELEDAPLTGWTLRDEVRMLGPYSVLPVKLYTPTTREIFALWGRWTVAPETVLLKIGKFRVL